MGRSGGVFSRRAGAVFYRRGSPGSTRRASGERADRADSRRAGCMATANERDRGGRGLMESRVD